MHVIRARSACLSASGARNSVATRQEVQSSGRSIQFLVALSAVGPFSMAAAWCGCLPCGATPLPTIAIILFAALPRCCSLRRRAASRPFSVASSRTVLRLPVSIRLIEVRWGLLPPLTLLPHCLGRHQGDRESYTDQTIAWVGPRKRSQRLGRSITEGV